jgi:hypothetical protein
MNRMRTQRMERIIFVARFTNNHLFPGKKEWKYEY